TGLDPVLSHEVDNLILETAQREKVTSLVISHDMASTFRIGDHIAMLYRDDDAKDGATIVAAGPPEKIKSETHRGVRRFLELSPGAARGRREPGIQWNTFQGTVPEAGRAVAGWEKVREAKHWQVLYALQGRAPGAGGGGGSLLLFLSSEQRSFRWLRR